MKLILTLIVEHDLLDIPTLMLHLPAALGAARTSLGAGIQETGPLGIQLVAAGATVVPIVHFKIAYAESAAARLPTAVPVAAADPASQP